MALDAIIIPQKPSTILRRSIKYHGTRWAMHEEYSGAGRHLRRDRQPIDANQTQNSLIVKLGALTRSRFALKVR